MTQHIRLRLAIVGAILMAGFVCAKVTPSYAIPDDGNAGTGSQIAPQPCDPRYWNTLTSRAWMEAEREIMQNQNLIFKPDSVLEYTCFDSLNSHAAHHLGDIFVHTEYFGKMIIQRGAAQSQEKALENVVYKSLKTYLNENFGDEFFSKRAPDMTNKPAITNRGDLVSMPTASGEYSTCKVMAEVWKASKCLNFGDNAKFRETDVFYPFRTLEPVSGGGAPVAGYNTEDLADIRKWPAECASPITTDDWDAELKLSRNEGDSAYPFQNPLKTNFEKVRKMVEPGQCGDPIFTGVKVILSGTSSNSKNDAVCTNPGCTYVGDKCQ